MLTHTCGHSTLLSFPEATLLCDSALAFNLRQGKDNAPAFCFPLPDDIHDPTQIAAINSKFSACEKCNKTTQYTISDSYKVDGLHTLIDEVSDKGYQEARAFEDSHEANGNLQDAGHVWLRVFLSRPGMQKFDDLFFDDVAAAKDWVRYLDACIEHEGPRAAFDETFMFVDDKIRRALRKVEAFSAVSAHLKALHDWPDSGAREWTPVMTALATDLQTLFNADNMDKDSSGTDKSVSSTSDS